MDSKQLAEMTGQTGNQSVQAYKLNEVRVNGDTGEFIIREMLSEKGEDGKYPTRNLGKSIKGVIVKSRWRLFRYEEGPGDNKSTVWMSSEYDSKMSDLVVLFNNGEKGYAADIKAKYTLGSQRVLYVYLQDGDKKEVVRVIVKPSAFSSEKNPDPTTQHGLFEYVDSFNKETRYLHEWVTEFGSVYREDEKNKRKSYYAMTFKAVKKLEDWAQGKVNELIEEVHSNVGKGFADTYTPPGDEVVEVAEEEVNPDDIPF